MNILLAVLMVVLAMLNLIYGSVSIPASQVLSILAGGTAEKASWNYIVMESRLPQAVTAIHWQVLPYSASPTVPASA